MTRGVQIYTVRDFLNDRAQVEETHRKVRAIGYDTVHSWVPPMMTAEEYKAMLDEIGLISLTAGGDYEAMLTDPAAIAKAVAEADLFETDYIGVGTLPEALRDHEAGFRRYAEGINAIARQLKPLGKKLIYHNHALEFYSLGGGRKGMDILLQETDPDVFHFCMDTHWLTAAGVDPAEWILKAEGRMQIIHFKDYKIVGGAAYVEQVRKDFAEVGEGNIAWGRILEACRKIGVQHVVVEQDTCPGDPFDSLAVSFRNLVNMGVE